MILGPVPGESSAPTRRTPRRGATICRGAHGPENCECRVAVPHNGKTPRVIERPPRKGKSVNAAFPRPCTARITRGDTRANGRENVAGATGLEPATFGVTGRRSNRLSYAPVARGVREIRVAPSPVKRRAERRRRCGRGTPSSGARPHPRAARCVPCRCTTDGTTCGRPRDWCARAGNAHMPFSPPLSRDLAPRICRSAGAARALELTSHSICTDLSGILTMMSSSHDREIRIIY